MRQAIDTIITGPMPLTCPFVCGCEPRYECHRKFDEWMDWRGFVDWLQTDGPGRITNRDFIALQRAYIQEHDRDGIIRT